MIFSFKAHKKHKQLNIATRTNWLATTASLRNSALHMHKIRELLEESAIYSNDLKAELTAMGSIRLHQ